jgi:hypothetical protein
MVEYPTKTLKIKFLDAGLDGSNEAFLSYEPSANNGHIWLVDTDKKRDCKGQWFLDNNEEYSWEIKCLDGYKASGSLTSPLKILGVGKGKDINNREVGFVFNP